MGPPCLVKTAMFLPLSPLSSCNNLPALFPISLGNGAQLWLYIGLLWGAFENGLPHCDQIPSQRV